MGTAVIRAHYGVIIDVHVHIGYMLRETLLWELVQTREVFLRYLTFLAGKFFLNLQVHANPKVEGDVVL